jgi:hypothetical protein
MISIEVTTRTKVFLDQEHVKTIPNKYEDIFREKHIINPKRKRLTQEERFKLEVSVAEFELRSRSVHAYNLVKRSIPDFVRKVTTLHNHYYELVYKNKVAIKVPIDLWRLCQDKREIKRNY